jgi:uncharacterized protein YcfJ
MILIEELMNTHYTQIISVSPIDDDKKCERELIRQFK